MVEGVKTCLGLGDSEPRRSEELLTCSMCASCASCCLRKAMSRVLRLLKPFLVLV